MVVRTHVSPLLVDIREGNEGTLIEMMMMPVGLIPEAVSELNIEISGNNEKIMISFDFKNYNIEELELEEEKVLEMRMYFFTI